MTIERWEIELVGVLIIVAAALMWLGFHDAAIKSRATAAVTAQVQKAEAAASAAIAAHDAKVIATQQENLNAALTQTAALEPAVRTLSALVDGLRHDAIRPVAAAGRPAASAPGVAASDPGADLVPGRLLDATAEAFADTAGDAADLAVYARGLRTSGGLCSGDYDALGTVKR